MGFKLNASLWGRTPEERKKTMERETSFMKAQEEFTKKRREWLKKEAAEGKKPKSLIEKLGFQPPPPGIERAEQIRKAPKGPVMKLAVYTAEDRKRDEARRKMFGDPGRRDSIVEKMPILIKHTTNGLLPNKQHTIADQIVNDIEKTGAVHGLPNGPPVLTVK